MNSDQFDYPNLDILNGILIFCVQNKQGKQLSPVNFEVINMKYILP